MADDEDYEDDFETLEDKITPKNTFKNLQGQGSDEPKMNPNSARDDDSLIKTIKRNHISRSNSPLKPANEKQLFMAKYEIELLKIRNFLDKSNASISSDTESENTQIRAHIKDLSNLLSKVMDDDNFKNKSNLNPKDADPMDLNFFEQTKKNNYKLLSVLNEDFLKLQNKYHSLLGNEYPNELDEKIKKTQLEIRSAKKIIHDSSISNHKNSKNLVFLEGNEFYFQNNLHQTQRELDVVVKKNKELKEKLLVSNDKLENINAKQEIVSQNLEKHERVAQKFGICLNWNLLAQSQLLTEKIKIEKKNIDILRKRENLLRKSYDSVIEEMAKNMSFSAKMTENKQRLIDMQRKLIEESKYSDFMFNQFTRNQYAQILNDLPQPAKSKSVIDMRKDVSEKKKKMESLTESRKKIKNLEEKLSAATTKFASVEERVDGDVDLKDYRKNSIDFAVVEDEVELAENNQKMFKFAIEAEEREIAKENNRKIQYKPNFKQKGVKDRNISFHSKEQKSSLQEVEVGGNLNKKNDEVPLKPNLNIKKNYHQSAPKIQNHITSTGKEFNNNETNETNKKDFYNFSSKNMEKKKFEAQKEKDEAFSNLKNNINIDHNNRANNFSSSQLYSKPNNENNKQIRTKFEAIDQIKKHNNNLNLNFQEIDQKNTPIPLKKEIPNPIIDQKHETESPQKQLNLNFFNNNSISMKPTPSKMNDSPFKVFPNPNSKSIKDAKPANSEEKTNNNLNLNFLSIEKKDQVSPKDNGDVLKIQEVDLARKRMEKEKNLPFQKKIIHKSAEPKNLEDYKVSAKKEGEKKLESSINLHQNQLKIQDSLQESKPFQMKKDYKSKNEIIVEKLNNEVKKQNNRFDEPKPFSIKKVKKNIDEEKQEIMLEPNYLANEKDHFMDNFNSPEKAEIIQNKDEEVLEPSKGFSRKTGKKILRQEEEMDNKVNDNQAEINLNNQNGSLKIDFIKMQKNKEENEEKSSKQEFNFIKKSNNNIIEKENDQYKNQAATLDKEQKKENEEVDKNLEIPPQKKKKFDFNKRFNLNSSLEENSKINASKINDDQIMQNYSVNSNEKTFNFNQPKKQNENYKKPQPEPDFFKNEKNFEQNFENNLSLNIDIKEKETTNIIKNNNSYAINKEENINISNKLKKNEIEIKSNLVDKKKIIETDKKNESLSKKKANDIFSDDLSKITFDGIIELKASEKKQISQTEEVTRKELFNFSEDKKMLGFFSNVKNDNSNFTQNQTKIINKPLLNQIPPSNSQNNKIKISSNEGEKLINEQKIRNQGLTNPMNSDLEEIILPESNKMIESEKKERRTTKNKANSIKKNDLNIIDDFGFEEPAEQSKRKIRKKTTIKKKEDDFEKSALELKKEESQNNLNKSNPNYLKMSAKEAEKKNDASIILLDDGLEETKPLKIKQSARKNETRKEDLKIEQTNFFDDWS